MINTWSELFTAIKVWWNKELTFERKNDIEPLEPQTAKMINDLMKAPRNLSTFDYYREYERNNLPHYRDPYYMNLKTDDSMWQDQIEQEIKDAEGRLQTESDPIKRAARRQELIKKIKAKYGFDQPNKPEPDNNLPYNDCDPK